MPPAIRRITLLLVALALLPASRAVAAPVCDLTTAGSSCSITGGTGSTGLFFTDEQHPTGTGYIDSFLRVQQNGYEQGYNTSDRSYNTPGGMQPIIQDKTDPNFTRDLPLSAIGTKTINGTLYAEFFLDVNEPAATNGNKNLITLDQLEIFTSASAGLNSYSNSGNNDASGALAGATKVYDMDTATTDNYVQIDYTLSGQGSGSSDMVFYLPYSLLQGSNYVYLFSEFGNIDGSNKKYASNGGFEEWFTKSQQNTTQTSVPEPTSLVLLGTGLLAAARWRRKASRG